MTLVLLVSYYTLLQLFLSLKSIPESSYYFDFIFYSLLRDDLLITLFFVSTFLIGITYATLEGRRFGVFEKDGEINYLKPLILIFGIYFYTYDYNFYLNNYHYYDRILLFLLMLLSLWRSYFLGPFLIIVYVVAFQFNYPFGYSWTDKLLPLHLLILGYTYVLIKPWLKIEKKIFFYVMLLVTSMYYLLPGFGKLYAGWFGHSNLHNIIIGAYVANGWFGWMDKSSIFSISEFVEQASYLKEIGTLMIECGVVLLLFTYRFQPLLLLGLIGLHLLIFLFTGIFFWKWIVALLLIILLRQRYKQVFHQIVTQYHPAFSATVLLALLVIYNGNINLTWFNTPVSHEFELTAHTDNGEKNIPAYSLKPFDIQFSQGRFYDITQTKFLTGTLSSVKKDEQHLNSMINTISKDKFLDTLETIGRVEYNTAAYERYREFFDRYVQNRNKENLIESILPIHIWSHLKDNRVELAERDSIFRINTILNMYYYTPHKSLDLIKTDTIHVYGAN